MNYIPLHAHSHFSLLDGLSKPADIASRIEEIESDACALTDHGSVSGHVDFYKKMKKAKKKPLLGIEFYVSEQDPTIKKPENRSLAHLCIIAKNKRGWVELMQMVSHSNQSDHYYYKPRLSFDQICQFAQNGNLMAFSGHIGSQMANVVCDREYKIRTNWKKDGIRLAQRFKEAFGRNFFLEVQLMDNMHFPVQQHIGDCIREIAQQTKIPCVGTPDAHYCRKKDAIDQRILLCSSMHTTLREANHPSFGLYGFFRSSQYHIPAHQEMAQWNTPEELDNTRLFASMVEEYDILRNPILPSFSCPNGLNPDEYLRQLCRDGWANLVKGRIPKHKHQEYGDRVKYELGVLQSVGLSSYFLIVKDIIDFCKGNEWCTGIARGSVGGSLISYLLGITSVDPIEYDLIFERFYNAGRNTKDRVSMPDIDMDVPKYSRDYVIEYIRNKYGEEHVGQMVSFQTMKGRGAIKDVLRAYGHLSFEEMNEITKNIIEEHKISDELAEMKKETGESSIIRWCLENTPKKLDSWCTLNEDGSLSGPLAKEFEQAMRLEGTKTAQSRHPAGVVIAPEPLNTMCPMILDNKTKSQIAGFEMDDLESVGGIKFDILGLLLLDKLMGITQDSKGEPITEI